MLEPAFRVFSLFTINSYDLLLLSFAVYRFCLYWKQDLYDLYSSPDIIQVIKSRRMIWAGHVARIPIYRVRLRTLYWPGSENKNNASPVRKMKSVQNILRIFAVRKWGVCCSRRIVILNRLADCLWEQSFNELSITSYTQTKLFSILQAHFHPYELIPLSQLSLLPVYLPSAFESRIISDAEILIWWVTQIIFTV
jgi:hypothetical protein